jgi:Uncharacterized conserved protein (DUF2190)
MSRQALPIFTLSALATTVLIAERFVSQSGAGTTNGTLTTINVAQTILAATNTLGVVRQAAAIGDKVTVDILGTAIVEAGGAITAGATVSSDTVGRAITWATGAAKVGMALQSASAAGQFIEVLLIPNVA